MKNPAWLALLGVIACGGDDAPQNPDGRVVDDDAMIDAPPGVEVECPTTGGGPPACGTTMAPTVPATNTNVCDPLTQTGCNANEKCTWIIDQTSPSIGHIGCTPRGTTPIGCACTIGAAGTTGYDDCVQGAACLGGVCKQICDHEGGLPGCGSGYGCQVYGDTFTNGGTAVAGLCDPTCDPLTQCMSAGVVTNACGSTNGAMPTRGCYGYDEFTCSPAAASTLTLTDRTVPRSNSSGTPFLNGCAPGFIPMFYESTGSIQTLCAGFCAALEIDNTPAHVNNGKGDATAVAKLPNEAKPRIGNGTCDAGKKGSEASSTCMFLWSYVIDDQGQVPGVFTPYIDTLGVCFAYSHFMWDADQNMSTGTDGKEAPYPDCATLPPRSAATTGVSDDAADWGCQKVANSMVTTREPRARRDVTVRALDAAPMVPHVFD